MGQVNARIRKQIYRKCDGHCAYCGKEVALTGGDGFQVDHLNPVYWNKTAEQCKEEGLVQGSDDYENLMPSCRRCNRWKGDDSVERFRERILDQINILKRENKGFNLLMDYGAVEIGPWDKTFYFERISYFSSLPKRVVAHDIQ